MTDYVECIDCKRFTQKSIMAISRCCSSFSLHNINNVVLIVVGTQKRMYTRIDKVSRERLKRNRASSSSQLSTNTPNGFNPFKTKIRISLLRSLIRILKTTVLTSTTAIYKDTIPQRISK